LVFNIQLYTNTIAKVYSDVWYIFHCCYGFNGICHSNTNWIKHIIGSLQKAYDRQLGFRKGASASTCSAITGAIASGCPVCTAPLLGVFGLGGALALFPFQGLELKLAAIVVLSISLYFTSKNVKIACKM
jgi:hypothetical protein